MKFEANVESIKNSIEKSSNEKLNETIENFVSKMEGSKIILDIPFMNDDIILKEIVKDEEGNKVFKEAVEKSLAGLLFGIASTMYLKSSSKLLKMIIEFEKIGIEIGSENLSYDIFMNLIRG